MTQYVDIKSQLDALKLKDIEGIFYEKMDEESRIIPKVTPFSGVNTDLLYVKGEQILFVKFVDTTEELFSILEEELLEIMNEEYDFLKNNMRIRYSGVNYNYVFIMPYVQITDCFGFDEFVDKRVLDKDKFDQILSGERSLDEFLSEENDEIQLNLFIMDICSEYYVVNGDIHLNDKFKRISFYDDHFEYTTTILEESQIRDVVSINYGDTLVRGGSGTGKTTIMTARAIKLAKVYPQHQFLIFTHSKQSCNEIKEQLDILYKGSNLEVHTFGSFIFKLAKKYSLILDYTMLKKDYDKTFKNLVKQADNIIKNKSIFKGIFVDEAEGFAEDDLEFIHKFLYKAKHIFEIYSCSALNISNNLHIFKEPFQSINFDYKMSLDVNYRQSKEICGYINRFGKNSNKFVRDRASKLDHDIFDEMTCVKGSISNVDIIKVSDLDDQINSVIWEIEHLTSNRGLKYDDICILFPYNKKKMKNGSVLYFQYMLKKACESANIPYMYADEDLTNLSKKIGVTLSNIYAIKSLEYKAVILCEIEMLYNQKAGDMKVEYQVNDFVGDLNKIYLAISRAKEYLKIITTFDESASDLVKLIVDSCE
ncbi:MAG: UvrD-helicase domain-containing protein [Clostridioides sp.]|jgi:hypothetical protein|nr:UvrD-helicase domain-containing protein [Clostridioides sp.]